MILVSSAQQSDSTIIYIVKRTTINLAIICHDIKLLHIINYITYAAHCIPMSHLFMAGSLYLLTPFPYFAHLTTAIPSDNHRIVLYIYELVSVSFVYLFF